MRERGVGRWQLRVYEGLDPITGRARYLKLREDQWFDRKSSRTTAQDLANSMIGFANAEGGMVVVGLWGGKVEGVDRAAKRPSEWQQAALDFTVPAVPCRNRLVDCINERGDADHLFVIEVETSENVHANRRFRNALIGGTALSYGMTVVTRVLKDFERFDGLEVLDPWR